MQSYYNDSSLGALIESMGLTIAAGMVLFFGSKRPSIDYISAREGMAIVALGWTAMGIVGALPFYLGNGLPHFTDAFFESVSGFTTTGSSVLTNIEGLSRSLLFWRSFIQWLGGMGIIVLSLAILPFLGVGGMQLFLRPRFQALFQISSPQGSAIQPRFSGIFMH